MYIEIDRASSRTWPLLCGNRRETKKEKERAIDEEEKRKKNVEVEKRGSFYWQRIPAAAFPLYVGALIEGETSSTFTSSLSLLRIAPSISIDVGHR